MVHQNPPIHGSLITECHMHRRHVLQPMSQCQLCRRECWLHVEMRRAIASANMATFYGHVEHFAFVHENRKRRLMHLPRHWNNPKLKIPLVTNQTVSVLDLNGLVLWANDVQRSHRVPERNDRGALSL